MLPYMPLGKIENNLDATKASVIPGVLATLSFAHALYRSPIVATASLVVTVVAVAIFYKGAPVPTENRQGVEDVKLTDARVVPIVAGVVAPAARGAVGLLGLVLRIVQVGRIPVVGQGVFDGLSHASAAIGGIGFGLIAYQLVRNGIEHLRLERKNQ